MASLLAWQGCDIVPDRRQVEISRFHILGQDFGAIGFPFHEQPGAVGVSDSELEGEVNRPNPGT